MQSDPSVPLSYILLGKPCWDSMTGLLSQSNRARTTERERVCVCVTKTMQHYSSLGNYGHNAGLSCKSSLKQKHTRTKDDNYPSQIMRWLDAVSSIKTHWWHYQRSYGETPRSDWNLPGSCDDNNNGPEATFDRNNSIKYDHSSCNVSKCVAVSVRLLHMCICVPCLPQSWQTQWCQLCVCLQVTLLTESSFSRRLTSFPQVDYTLLMEAVSQLCDNFLSRPLSQSILKPLRNTD